MPDTTPHIAVMDIGKTNKKVLIYDYSLNLLDVAYGNFPEYVDGRIHYEDVESTFKWLRKQLKQFSSTYHIQAISISTHGATAMGIDANGDLAVPPVAYTTEVAPSFREEFYETFGRREKLQQETATPEVGELVNLAKLLFFMKKQWPQQYEKIETVLNYPQYIGFLFTGQIGVEPTYLGCHSYLYDFQNNTYSDVAVKLGLADKLPWPLRSPWETLGTVKPDIANETGLPESCLVTLGVHDSNAALLPYLVKGYDNFVLNSTGTWCVAMRPAQQVTFQQEELGKLVLYNLDVFGRPVKTSIFMGGLEHDTYLSILKNIHGRDDTPEPDLRRLEQILREKRHFIFPSVLQDTGIFPNARARVVDGDKEYPLEDIQAGSSIPPMFNDYEFAYTVLTLSLAIQTKTALDMIGFQGNEYIFTEGGFRKNPLYNTLISALFPHAVPCLTKLDEASAFGAAILAKAALEQGHPADAADCFEIDMRRLSPPERLPGLNEYVEAFQANV